MFSLDYLKQGFRLHLYAHVADYLEQSQLSGKGNREALFPLFGITSINKRWTIYFFSPIYLEVILLRIHLLALWDMLVIGKFLKIENEKRIRTLIEGNEDLKNDKENIKVILSIYFSPVLPYYLLLPYTIITTYYYRVSTWFTGSTRPIRSIREAARTNVATMIAPATAAVAADIDSTANATKGTALAANVNPDDVW